MFSSSLESESDDESLLLDSDVDVDDESDPVVVVVVVAFVVVLSCERRRAELSMGCTSATGVVTGFGAISGCASATVACGGLSIITTSLPSFGAGDDSDESSFLAQSSDSVFPSNVRRFADCSSVTIDNLRLSALMLLSVREYVQAISVSRINQQTYCQFSLDSKQTDYFPLL